MKPLNGTINWPTDEELIDLVNKNKTWTKVGKILNCDPSTVYNRCKTKKLKVTLSMSRVDSNKDIFLDEDDLSYYLLGAYITDGSIYKPYNRVNMHSSDKDWLIDIKNYIAPNSNIIEHKRTKDNGSKKPAYDLSIGNKDIMNWLISNECVERKSLIVKMPNVPEKYLRDFVRGVIDGDGCIYSNFYTGTNKNLCCRINIRICSSSFDFVNPLSSKLNSLGFTNTIIERDIKSHNITKDRIISNTANSYAINFNAPGSVKILNWAYYKDNRLSLKRKQEKADAIVDYYKEKYL